MDAKGGPKVDTGVNLAHFWTLRDCVDVREWDPDADPNLHQSGYGHSFLELYARLARAGERVTIGPRLPRHPGVVVVCLEELSEWHRHGVPAKSLVLCRRLLGRGAPLVLIRNDVHPHIRAPFCTSLEVVPTHASVERPEKQRYLPLLPQRGLTQRATTRPPRIQTVGLKSYRENLPDWLPEVAQRLAEQGVVVRQDLGEPDGHAWTDFTDLDAVLCSQPVTTLGDPRRKPATKLINAWAAGVIPICETHVGYTELARSGCDSVFADGPDATVAAVLGVNADPALAQTMFVAARQRGEEFSTARVLTQWVVALSDVSPLSRRRAVVEMAICLTQMCLGPRVARRVEAAATRWSTRR